MDLISNILHKLGPESRSHLHSQETWSYPPFSPSLPPLHCGPYLQHGWIQGLQSLGSLMFNGHTELELCKREDQVMKVKIKYFCAESKVCIGGLWQYKGKSKRIKRKKETGKCTHEGRGYRHLLQGTHTLTLSFISYTHINILTHSEQWKSKN